MRRFKYRGTPWKGAFNPHQHSPNHPITMSDKRSGCWGHGMAPRNEHHGIRLARSQTQGIIMAEGYNISTLT